MSRIKVLIWLSISLLFSVIVYHSWFSLGIFTNSDWGFAYAQTLSEYLKPHVWLYWSNFGVVDYLFWRTPITIAQGVLGSFGYGSSISDKILVFFPTLLLSNVAMFLIAKKVIKSNIASFISTLIYNYNTYIFISGTAFLLYAASAWALVSFYFFTLSMERKKLKWFLLSGLALFLSGSYDFRIVYITIFLLIFYFLFYNLIIEKFEINKFFRGLLLFIAEGCFFVFANVYWILPLSKSNSLVSNVILDRSLFGNEFLNILYSISFYHPFWTGITPTIFHPQQIMIYFWVIPIFAFSSIYLNKKNKNILFFGTISLFGIFLTKQIGIPFSGVYPWLFQHLPGFSAFREASKFYFLISLGYAILLGAFINWLLIHWKKIRFGLHITYFLIAFIAIIFLLNTLPIISGSFGTIYIQRNIPADYLKLKSFLVADNKFSRTIWIPAYSRWGFVSSNHPEINSIDEIYGDWNSYIKKLQNPNYVYEGKLITDFLSLKESRNILNLGSVKYLIIPTEDKKNSNNVFGFYGEPRQFYINQLNKISWIKKVNLGLDDLVVYENVNFRPHIYTTLQKENIGKSLPSYAFQVESNFVTGSEYKITIKNIKKSFYLNFTEAYHPQWKLYSINSSWIYPILNSLTLSDKNHFKTEAGQNSFYLDPKKLCRIERCSINKDGSYNVSLKLLFVPQSYFYLGLIVSGVAFIIVFGYLIFVFGRNFYEKAN